MPVSLKYLIKNLNSKSVYGGPRLSGWLGPKKVPQYFWYHYPQNRNSKNRGIATIDWIFYWSQYCKIKVIEVTLMEDPLYLQINICFLGLDITKIYPISTQFMSTEESIDYCNTSWYTPMIFLLEKSTNVNSHSVISL